MRCAIGCFATTAGAASSETTTGTAHRAPASGGRRPSFDLRHCDVRVLCVCESERPGVGRRRMVADYQARGWGWVVGEVQ